MVGGGVTSSRGDEHGGNKPPFLSTLKHGKSDIIYIDDFDVATGAGFDLYFFCSDGVVSAHRLVISNVSKFVMTMLDDQPMWHPSHIHVPDLPKTIMQILVDLAYTGEMKFPMDLQSDVFDAMQTLGWIHTDCLSADFCDSEQGLADVDKEGSKVNKEFKKQSKEVDTKESPVSPKMHFSLAAAKGNAQDGMPADLGPTLRLSFNEEVDESMELSRVPDLILSDDDELVDSGPKSPVKTSRARKRFSELKNDLDAKTMPSPKRTTRGGSVQKSAQPKKEKAAPKRSARERKEEKKSEEVSQVEETSTTETVLKKRGRKPKVETAASSVVEDEPEAEPEGNHISEVETSASVSTDDTSQTSITSESSQNDSPGKRQRRKPKRFEDFEEIPERTISPSKAKLPSILKDKPKPKVLDFETNVSASNPNKRNAVSTKNETDKPEEILILSQEPTQSNKTINTEKAKPSNIAKFGRKKKLSGESPKQSSLITAYFSKQKGGSDSPSQNSATDNHEEEATKAEKLVEKSVDSPNPDTPTNSKSDNNLSALEDSLELDVQTELKGRTTRKKPSNSVDSSNQKVEKAKVNKPAKSDSEQEQSDQIQLASGSSEIEVELVGLPVPSPGSSRPSRKSSRVSSRSSVAPSEGKNDDDEPAQPIKKRARKEEPEENNL